MSDWVDAQPVWKLSEIAARLRCDESTVRLWCAQGVLAAQRTIPGNPKAPYRVSASALREFLCPRAA